MDALSVVINSVPQWHSLLDDIKNHISRKQLELAKFDDNQLPTRSLKPKGSTESLLRPKEVEEHPIIDSDNPPTPTKNTVFSSSSTPTRPAQHMNSNATDPIVLQKRKTPRRMRSMVMVYYDSATQIALEELVRRISASRNAMRKGKLAARMADLKKMVEMETETDDQEDEGSSLALVREIGDTALSTRKLGPTLTAASFVSIFYELDTTLEWCQRMCEHAAYQVLRDGHCDTEIEDLKKRLWKAKKIAETQQRSP